MYFRFSAACYTNTGILQKIQVYHITGNTGILQKTGNIGISHYLEPEIHDFYISHDTKVHHFTH